MSPDLMNDPAWFPDRIDWHNHLVKLVKVKHATLCGSAFLDGRTPLNDEPGDSVVLDLSSFAAHSLKPPAMRWIFHESFCGSTLLARTMTIANYSLCLREPQILVDLTNWRLAASSAELPIFHAVRDAVLYKLAQPWSAQERLLIKPSNWVTPIVTDLWNPARGDRAAIVRSAAEPFLVAVLRGGRDRIAYMLSLYPLLASVRPDLADRAEKRMTKASNPLEHAIQLVAIVYWFQEHILADACSDAYLSIEGGSVIFPNFLDDIELTAKSLSVNLDLNLPDKVISRSVRENIGRHSKTNAPVKRGESEEAVNAVLRHEHGEAIRAGLFMLSELDPTSCELFLHTREEVEAGEPLGAAR